MSGLRFGGAEQATETDRSAAIARLDASEKLGKTGSLWVCLQIPEA
jgi:hypothetical protein